MKKILVACIGTNLGGIERSLIEFLKYITEQDCEVDFIHWKKPGALYDQIPKKVNIASRLSPMGLSDIKKIKNPFKLIKEFFWFIVMKLCKAFHKPWKCFKRLKKHYDVAISYCQNGYSPYYIIDKVDADKKYLWYHHGSYDEQGKSYERDKAYFAKYDSLIAVSEPCKEMLSEYFPNCNIDVVHNIINIEEIRLKAEEPIADKPKTAKHTLVTVSRYSYEKGIDIAIETAKRLKEKGLDFCWYFVGEGPYRAEAEKLIAAYGLERQCILLGARSNPYPYIKNADVYVQASRVESYGLSVVEAIILGKAIVASNIPAIKKVTQGGTWSTCVDLDPAVLASTIEKICVFSEERMRLEQAVKSAKIGNTATFLKINDLLCI